MGTHSTANTRRSRQDTAGKRGGVEERYDAEFVGYVNVQLSDEQKRAFDAWLDSSSPLDALESFTADGINFSLKFESRSGGFLASATQRRVGSPNAGLCVTARARQALVAFWRVVYSVTILSHTEKWTDTQPMADPDRW